VPTKTVPHVTIRIGELIFQCEKNQVVIVKKRRNLLKFPCQHVCQNKALTKTRTFETGEHRCAPQCTRHLSPAKCHSPMKGNTAPLHEHHGTLYEIQEAKLHESVTRETGRNQFGERRHSRRIMNEPKREAFQQRQDNARHIPKIKGSAHG
jgi:hypothetical protein